MDIVIYFIISDIVYKTPEIDKDESKQYKCEILLCLL